MTRARFRVIFISVMAAMLYLALPRTQRGPKAGSIQPDFCEVTSI